MEERLQKFIASTGICSRRAAERLIANGEIKVNGEVVTEMGIKVDTALDQIEYKGENLNKEEGYSYYLLHKKVRVVSTASDEKGRMNVVDCISSPHRTYPVGRLDFMSSGLIILTNDGDLTYKLTHPKHEISKEYVVRVTPIISKKKVEFMKKGMDIGEEVTQPCVITLVEEKKGVQTYRIVLHEGKNRQIRRMFEQVESKVLSLERVAIGKIRIKGLKYGTYRMLTKEEIVYLKSL